MKFRDEALERETPHFDAIMFSFEELETRLVMGSIKSASSSGAVAAAKFVLLNYLAISQIVMVIGYGILECNVVSFQC